MTRQPLWVILCRLPEKGRKDIGEIVEEMKEEQGRKRNRNESEETEKIKTFPLYQGSGNSEIWIGPADDDDVINEPISKKQI